MGGQWVGEEMLKCVFLWLQVKNFTDVHPDYGARVQAHLDKYNAEKPKVSQGGVTGRGVRAGLDRVQFGCHWPYLVSAIATRHFLRVVRN